MMKIKCTRPVLTRDGILDIEFIFDTETLELTFDETATSLLVDIYHTNDAVDMPEFTQYQILD